MFIQGSNWALNINTKQFHFSAFLEEEKTVRQHPRTKKASIRVDCEIEMSAMGVNDVNF